MTRLLAVVLATLSLSAPAFAEPVDTLGLPGEWSTGPSPDVPDTPWWSTFGDPQLAAVVERAVVGNLDLQSMRAVARQAEANTLASFSALLPGVSANANAQLAPLDTLGFGFIPPGATGGADPDAPKNYYNGQATLDATWGLDLFGRNTASWNAARNDAAASRRSADDLARSTAGFVANAYLDVLTARERLRLLDAQIQTNEELLEVLTLRFERGDTTSLDVLQQRQSLAAVLAQRPSAELLAETAAQRLAVLLGEAPTTAIVADASLPELPDTVALGVPADLTRHRPDLAAEAERLQAARSRRWSATAGALPSLGVSATTGYQFIDTGEFQSQSFWNAGVKASVPIFNGGRTLAGVRQSRAAYDAQEATLAARTLEAVRQVESALAQERLVRRTLDAQIAQLEAARQAAATAREQYLEGLTPFLNVQTTITREQTAEQTVLQARRDVLTARIALHDALGGPWTRALAERSAPTSSPSEARP
jgi:NodT family efflux transporter outer membrane factor (OMF) lipoprotein